MKTLLKNGYIFTNNGFEKRDVFVIDDRISLSRSNTYDESIDCDSFFIIPGFVDVHVHLREPGFFYKESIRTGTMAAAKGGYTAVCAMPNLNPAPSTAETLQQQLDIIKKDAVIKVYPYGTITKAQNGRGALSDMEDMQEKVIAYSDDGKGVQTGPLMEEAMNKAKSLDKIIVAHCEDETLLHGGYIHDGAYAADHGHKGICSESEWGQVQRDIELCKKTGVRYHVCHISTKETVALIRQAKKDGVRITCETAPHYLVLCHEDLQEDGRFKMNPPLREAEDREALIEGLLDGTIDMIATDHAPHSQAEKSKGLAGSAFGIVGLETAFPVLHTALVKAGRMSLEKLIYLMAIAPREVFGIEGGYLQEGQLADLAILDLNAASTIEPQTFLSKGRSTPFAGMKVTGETVMTFVNGKKVWSRDMKKNLYTIVSNKQLTDSIYEMRLAGDTSRITAPGQFVNIKIRGFYLRRPISICDWDGETLTIIYKTVGQGTEKLARMQAGEELDILCPLGNGYDLDKIGSQPVLAGGGVGVPPMYGLAKALVRRGIKPQVILGFNTKDEVFYEEEFKALGAEVKVTTADGSYGIPGFVTHAMEQPEYGCACGPEPMLRAVAEKVKDGQFSFEARMACGFGGCMGCSCETKYGAKRICKEGPVLEKEEIIW